MADAHPYLSSLPADDGTVRLEGWLSDVGELAALTPADAGQVRAALLSGGGVPECWLA